MQQAAWRRSRALVLASDSEQRVRVLYRDLRSPGSESWRHREGPNEPYGGRKLLVDTSAWTEIDKSKKREDTPREWTDAMERGQLLLSPIVRLELLHHARSPVEVESRDELFGRLDERTPKKGTYAAAIRAVRELAARGGGYHRVGLAGAVIAASAQEASLAVLHNNAKDFKKLATVLAFEEVPLVPDVISRPDAQPGERYMWKRGYGPGEEPD